jgi:hypothetical protein
MLRAYAAEAIGEEIWQDPKKQKRVLEVGGLDALLALCNDPTESVDAVLPSLWSMRNILQGNVEAQAQFNYRDGISVMMALVGRCADAPFGDQTVKVVEAALCCLVAGLNGNERNCRKLLVIGLEGIIDIVEGKSLSDSAVLNEHAKAAMQHETVVALARSLLLMLAPYNYVVCRNCHTKQDLNGTTCYHCGHRLRVELVRKEGRRPQTSDSTASGAGNSRLARGSSQTATRDIVAKKILLSSTMPAGAFGEEEKIKEASIIMSSSQPVLRAVLDREGEVDDDGGDISENNRGIGVKELLRQRKKKVAIQPPPAAMGVDT